MTTYKPAKNHPWRTGPSSKVLKWAKEESSVTNIQTLRVGQLEGLKRKDSSKMTGGLL